MEVFKFYGLGGDEMTDNKCDNHDVLYQDGIKLLEDALTLFVTLDSPHGKAITVALQGSIILGKLIFDSYKK